MFKFEKDKRCLMPIDLFEVEVDIPFSKERSKKFSSFQLPTFTDLFYTSSYAEVGLYYNTEGLGGTLEVDVPFTGSEYPDFTGGDAFELFISTKDMRKSSSVSRFCHHFVLFPVEIGGFYGKEITRFRQDDTRALFDPLPLEVQSVFDKKKYTMDFFIPKSVLYGFEEIGTGISFTYIVHASKNAPQYFSVSAENFSIPQMPALWAYGLVKPEK